jgi:hypothetical protein
MLRDDDDIQPDEYPDQFRDFWYETEREHAQAEFTITLTSYQTAELYGT